MKTIFYNYCLTRPDKKDPYHPELDQPFWFGKGKNKRMYVHRAEAIKCLKYPSLPRDIRINIIIKLWEQGLDFVEEKICMNIPEQAAFENEKLGIAKYGRINNYTGCLANLTNGGEGNSGYVWSEEALLKLSISLKAGMTEERRQIVAESNRNRIWTAESRQKSSISLSGENNGNWRREYPPEQIQHIWDYYPDMSGENNPFYNHHHTNEWKQNHSERMAGENHPFYDTHLSEEHRNNISISLTGKKHTEEHRKHNSESKKGKPGQPKSDESKKKMGNSMKLRWKYKKWDAAILEYISQFIKIDCEPPNKE